MPGGKLGIIRCVMKFSSYHHKIMVLSIYYMITRISIWILLLFITVFNSISWSIGLRNLFSLRYSIAFNRKFVLIVSFSKWNPSLSISKLIPLSQWLSKNVHTFSLNDSNIQSFHIWIWYIFWLWNHLYKTSSTTTRRKKKYTKYRRKNQFPFFTHFSKTN